MSSFIENLKTVIKTERYRKSIEETVKRLQDTLWNPVNPALVKNFTNHTLIHSTNIFGIILDIIKKIGKVKKKYTERDYYIFAMSSLLHDVGLFCKMNPKIHNEVVKHFSPSEKFIKVFKSGVQPMDYTEEQQEVIRENHHLISTAWIKLNREDKTEMFYDIFKEIDENELNQISKNCMYHSKYKIEEIKEGDDEKRSILLFRLADELDIGESRISGYALEENMIPSKNSIYWVLNKISSINITENAEIALVIKVSKNDARKHEHCFKKIIEEFNEKNDKLLDELRNLGVIGICFSNPKSKIIPNRDLDDLRDNWIKLIYSKYNIKFQDSSVGVIKSKNDKIICHLIYGSKDFDDEKIRSLESLIKKCSNRLISVKTFSIKEVNLILDFDQNCFVLVLGSKEIFDNKNELNRLISNGQKFYMLDCLLKKNSSAFDDLSNYMFQKFDFSFFQSKNRNDKKVSLDSYSSKEHVTNIINKISKDVLNRMDNNSDEFKNSFYHIFGTLFGDTKAETSNLAPECMVETRAMEQLKDKRMQIAIGRKGSGKSILVRSFPQTKNYFCHIGIRFEDINNIDKLNKLFEKNEDSLKGLSKDIDGIYGGMHNTMIIVWQYFIYVNLLYRLTKGLFMNLSPKQKEYCNIIKKEAGSIFANINILNDEKISKYLFEFSIDEIVNFLEDGVKKMDETIDFTLNLLQLKTRFNIFTIIETRFSKDLISNFKKIISLFTTPFLITLDCFDDLADIYRLDIDGGNKPDFLLIPAKIENVILTTLYDVLYKFTNNNDAKSALGFEENVEGLICIPHDRYIESQKNQRDSYKFLDKIVYLRWNGKELLEMLLKRLDYHKIYLANGQKTKQSGSILEATENKDERKNFSVLFNALFPKCPKELSCFLGNKSKKYDVFLYVLRLSFWRPRDILYYFSKVITPIKLSNDNKKVIDEKIIRNAIEEGAKDIINNEFIKEYSSIAPNLGNEIVKFRGFKAVSTWEDIIDVISDLSLSPNLKLDNPFEKFKFLYDIGFLGIRVSDDLFKRYSLLAYDNFTFNEGRDLLNIGDSILKECKILIHPIFHNYLNINLDDASTVLDLTWDYLYNNSLT